MILLWVVHIPGNFILFLPRTREGYPSFAFLDQSMNFFPSDFILYRYPKYYIHLRFQVSVNFVGKESHAAAFPWEGINALDAAVNLYQSLGLLRQQLKPSCRLHGMY